MISITALFPCLPACLPAFLPSPTPCLTLQYSTVRHGTPSHPTPGKPLMCVRAPYRTSLCAKRCVQKFSFPFSPPPPEYRTCRTRYLHITGMWGGAGWGVEGSFFFSFNCETFLVMHERG